MFVGLKVGLPVTLKDEGAAYEVRVLDEAFPAVEEVAGHMKPPKTLSNDTGGTAPNCQETWPSERLLDRIDGRCGAYCCNVMTSRSSVLRSMDRELIP